MLEGNRNARIANQLIRKLFPPKLPHLMPAGDAPVWGGHWWWTAYRQSQHGEPEEPPCPHCHYFGGEEHHPACPVTERRARAWYARRDLTEPIPGTPEPLVLESLAAGVLPLHWWEVRHG